MRIHFPRQFGEKKQEIRSSVETVLQNTDSLLTELDEVVGEHNRLSLKIKIDKMFEWLPQDTTLGDMICNEPECDVCGEYESMDIKWNFYFSVVPIPHDNNRSVLDNPPDEIGWDGEM